MSQPEHDVRFLNEALTIFADPVARQHHLRLARWPGGEARCPHCNSERVVQLAGQLVWKCREGHPQSKFSMKVGTVVEGSHLSWTSWFATIWLLANREEAVSSYQLAGALGVPQKTAWSMLRSPQASRARYDAFDPSVRDG